MPPDLSTMIERTTRLRVACAGGAPREALLAEMEDALSAGYAEALAGDAWSMHTEQRLCELVAGMTVLSGARPPREVADEHARFQRELVALRHALAGLRHDRDVLRAALSAVSA